MKLIPFLGFSRELSKSSSVVKVQAKKTKKRSKQKTNLLTVGYGKRHFYPFVVIYLDSPLCKYFNTRQKKSKGLEQFPAGASLGWFACNRILIIRKIFFQAAEVE